MDRRLFLAQLAAAGAAGAAAPAGAAAQSAARIDVHHHPMPPRYRDALGAKITGPLTTWTPERSLADMDAAGVRTAILSITNPGLYFGDVAAARTVARACNEYAAELIRSHPGRFGMFAALPMPDPDATLAEIAYALDTLKLDGVGMFTSYGNRWLGDPAFEPVFAELNRRNAIVYTHPAGNACCMSLVPFVPPSAIEYGTDTTRAIASYLFSGAAARYPDVRVIFSHAGGTMPFLIERFDFMMRDPALAAKVPGGLRPALARFHYDTAQSSSPEAMGALVKLVPVSQIVFGSDYPFRTEPEHVANLRTCGFSDADLRAIEHDNAARLLSRGA
ncbi:MAG TPA: amidohydrolase family protein [Candidatus Elarobacter sp.]|nr:amidohydrolase family protein [Candidatus Elarobacter sp.]